GVREGGGADAWGGGVLVGPPGLVATYGPLGPGLTANAIAAAATANGGTLSASQQVDLASEQQTELGTLFDRYRLGGQLQLASGSWGLGLALRASASRSILPRLCRSQQAQAAGAGASAAPTGASATSAGASTAPAGEIDAPAGAQP